LIGFGMIGVFVDVFAITLLLHPDIINVHKRQSDGMVCGIQVIAWTNLNPTHYTLYHRPYTIDPIP